MRPICLLVALLGSSSCVGWGSVGDTDVSEAAHFAEPNSEMPEAFKPASFPKKLETFVETLFWANQVLTQGFSVLGAEANEFAQPEADYAIHFPQDHGAHPEFRIEWWYLTAVLADQAGRDYGVQWTLFRTAIHPGDGDGSVGPQVWMGHVGLTSSDQHFSDERFARGGSGRAGVINDPFLAKIDNWEMRGAGPGIDRLTLDAQSSEFAYYLDLSATEEVVFHGHNGYSVKSSLGHAGFYYSQPFYSVKGTLSLADGEVEVRGTGWFDHEWSSQPLAPDQDGWDWISLHLDDGSRLMGVRIRGADSTFTSATYVSSAGTVRSYPDGALRLTPIEFADVSGRSIPVRWRVNLPAEGTSVEVEALNRDAWMATRFPYWEGPVQVSGSHKGRGYLEMTGYR